MAETKEWPKAIQKDGFTYEAKDQKDFDAHARLGWGIPYQYQPFPKVVHGPKGASRSVKNDAELAEALAAGWSRQPVDDAAEVV